MSQVESNKEMKEEPILTCPQCKDYMIIRKINCGIFRHGVLKKNGKQINPHANKELCDYYVRENKIYGCGRPFRIILVDNKFETELCGYI
jgi:hypothetical protein